MTAKEKIIRRLERLSEAELRALEAELEGRYPLSHPSKEERIKRQLEALRAVTGILSDPEDIRAFEEATRRRPLFRQYERDEEPTDVPES